MEKLPPKPKKPKGLTRKELLELTKEELADRLLQLEAHNFQLKNIISKNLSDESIDKDNPPKNQKKFDFSKCNFRSVLLHIMYFGWDYQGFVVQEDTLQTIEHHLFSALTRTCFIESRETAQYHRCGRTDKGVSAFGQVISLNLRSKHPPGQQNSLESIATELEYCKILNRVLPKEIRAVAWMPVPEDKPEFSARFNCTKRQYKYYFPKSDLNIEAMREACKSLIGSHDFRNLCKMDVGNGVTEFRREILKAEIICITKRENHATSMYCILIEGNAFLWHQIRCIAAVLLLIGEGREPPSIIDELLDHHNNDRKPQYSMAIDIPLNLFKCSYDLEETQDWVYDEDNLANIITHLQGDWTLHNVKTTMIEDCLRNLEEKYANVKRKKRTEDAGNLEREEDRIIAYAKYLTQGVKSKNYVPLMKRATCSTLQEKIAHYKKRRKLPTEETAESKL